MSTHFQQYLIRGVSLDYDAWKHLYDDFEPYFSDEYPIKVLFDGMNGEFIVVGEVLAKSDKDQPFGFDVLIVPQGKAYHHGLGIAVTELLATEVRDLPEFQTMVVTHWT
jgi:hypothetical protein